MKKYLSYLILTMVCCITSAQDIQTKYLERNDIKEFYGFSLGQSYSPDSMFRTVFDKAGWRYEKIYQYKKKHDYTYMWGRGIGIYRRNEFRITNSDSLFYYASGYISEQNGDSIFEQIQSIGGEPIVTDSRRSKYALYKWPDINGVTVEMKRYKQTKKNPNPSMHIKYYLTDIAQNGRKGKRLIK